MKKLLWAVLMILPLAQAIAIEKCASVDQEVSMERLASQPMGCFDQWGAREGGAQVVLAGYGSGPNGGWSLRDHLIYSEASKQPDRRPDDDGVKERKSEEPPKPEMTSEQKAAEEADLVKMRRVVIGTVGTMALLIIAAIAAMALW